MSKFIDNTGVDTLVRALLSNTKKINGKTIWGAGNLEISGSVIDIDLGEGSLYSENLNLDPGSIYRLKNYASSISPNDNVHDIEGFIVSLNRAESCDIYVVATSANTFSPNGVMVITQEGQGDPYDNDFTYSVGDALDVTIKYGYGETDIPVYITEMYDPIRDIRAPYDFIFISDEGHTTAFPISNTKHFHLKSGGPEFDGSARWIVKIGARGSIENVEIGNGCTSIYLCATDIEKLYISDNCSNIKAYFKDVLTIKNSSNISIFQDSSNDTPNIDDMLTYYLSTPRPSMDKLGLPQGLIIENSSNIKVGGIKTNRNNIYYYRDVIFKNCNQFNFIFNQENSNNADTINGVGDLGFYGCKQCTLNILTKKPVNPYESNSLAQLSCFLHRIDFNNLTVSGYVFLRSFDRSLRSPGIVSEIQLSAHQYFYNTPSETTNTEDVLPYINTNFVNKNIYLPNPLGAIGAPFGREYFYGTYLGIQIPYVGDIRDDTNLASNIFQYLSEYKPYMIFIPCFGSNNTENWASEVSAQWGPQA